MRGEYKQGFVGHWLPMELPPHARRIRRQTTDLAQFLGTTSAHAENTPQYYGGTANQWNYLRMRGEYTEDHIWEAKRLELPPHARRIPFGRMLTSTR